MRDSCNKPITDNNLFRVRSVVDSIGLIKYGRTGSNIRKLRTDGKYYQVWFFGPFLDSTSCDSLINHCYKTGGGDIYLTKANAVVETLQGYWSGASPPCVPCGCNGYVILDSLFHVLNERDTPATDSCNRYK